MTRPRAIMLLALTLAAVLMMRISLAQPADAPAPAAPTPTFTWVDVYIDSGDRPLAAYQLEVRDARGAALVVGIEGSGGVEREMGELVGPFADPPYYDPAAMMNDRIIIAALSADPVDRLPTGRTRVARLHFRIAPGAEPDLQLTLHAAAGPDARPINAAATLMPGGNP